MTDDTPDQRLVRRVRFEVDAPADLEALDGDGSICAKAGF